MVTQINTPIDTDTFKAEIEPLYSFISSRVGHDLQLTEDLTQETFAAALDGVFDETRGPLKLWLIGIALHKIADHQRRTYRRNDDDDNVLRERASRIDRQPLPEDVIQKEEFRMAVNEALARIPIHYSSVLLGKYFEQLSVSELASRHGTTAKTIESLLVRARDAFRDAFGGPSGAGSPVTL